MESNEVEGGGIDGELYGSTEGIFTHARSAASQAQKGTRDSRTNLIAQVHDYLHRIAGQIARCDGSHVEGSIRRGELIPNISIGSSNALRCMIKSGIGGIPFHYQRITAAKIENNRIRAVIILCWKHFKRDSQGKSSSRRAVSTHRYVVLGVAYEHGVNLCARKSAVEILRIIISNTINDWIASISGWKVKQEYFRVKW